MNEYKPQVKEWMVNAANDIDQQVGLSRFDLAIQRTAEIIAEHHLAAFIRDQERHDETYRLWWNSLTPAQQADHHGITGPLKEIFVAHLTEAERRKT